MKETVENTPNQISISLAELKEKNITDLAKIAKEEGLPLLSMGMSEDFEIAIRFGATHVRVGSAIFGAREKHQ